MARCLINLINKGTINTTKDLHPQNRSNATFILRVTEWS
jgi:hypothetical protein